MSGLAVFGIGFVVSVIGMMLIVSIPLLRQASSVAPTEDRWHRQVTPGLGGIPMFVAFACAVWFGGVGLDSPTAAVMAGASLLFIVGVVDDLHQFRAGLKLLAQVVAASLVVVIGDLRWVTTEMVWFDLPLGILWIVMLANGINLLDNMDGLAGGVALIASIAIVILLMNTGQGFQSTRIMLIGLSGALLGFLVFNINPARLFMGDSGSQWLGLVIGANSLALLTSSSELMITAPMAWLVAVLILVVPILDTSFVIITRKLRGQAASQGGRDHLSHRLVSLGFSERSSVAILWLLSIGGACVAFAFINAGLRVRLPMLIVFVICVVVTIRAVLRVTIASEHKS